MEKVQNPKVDKVYRVLKLTAYRAAKILLKYKGKVENIGKADSEGGTFGVDEAKARMAKIILDDVLQELLLADLYRIGVQVRINTEEDTPLLTLFEDSQKPVCTVHCDPCDGTLCYLGGGNDFSSGYAISDSKNNFTHTVIAMPGWGQIFLAAPNTDAMVLDMQRHPIPCPVADRRSRQIYNKRMLSEIGVAVLEKAGFVVSSLIPSSHAAILQVALGRAGAFLVNGGNVHDVLIPYAFASKLNTTLLNSAGYPIDFAQLTFRGTGRRVQFDRVPSVCYVSLEEDSDRQILFNILSQRINLHPDYLERWGGINQEPQPRSAKDNELLVVVDENDRIIGRETRKKIHDQGLLHREADVLVTNLRGEVLLQRRADNGLWSFSAGGHCSSEDPVEDLLRELREELGLRAKRDQVHLSDRFKDIREGRPDGTTGKVNNKWKYLYLLRMDVDTSKLRLDTNEVTEVKFFSVAEIARMMESPNVFMRGTKVALQKHFLEKTP